MANIKITDLSAYYNPSNSDVLPIVDTATGMTKKVTISALLTTAPYGSEAFPAFAFDNNTNTGWYSPGLNQLSVATNGVERLCFDANGQIEAASFGTVTVPTYTFKNSPSTGVYLPSFNDFAIVTAGTEGLRITNEQVWVYNQAAPPAVNATANLTVSQLKAGIITSTSAAVTNMTLPTGAFTEAGFNSPYTSMAFEWSVVNTGPSSVNVLPTTGHNLIGSGLVFAGTSGRFSSRRTAANNFVTYRLS
jgi:hypothetical protein